MTLDRTAKELTDLVQQASTVRQSSAPSGGNAGTTISLRFNGRPFQARCLSAIAPGPVVAVLTTTGWACMPVAATRLLGVREVESRQRRGGSVPVKMIIFSFIIRRNSDNRLFLAKGLDIGDRAPIAAEMMQDLGGSVAGSAIVLTVAYQDPAFSVGAVTSAIEPFEARFFEGIYPESVATSEILNSDFAANFSNNNVTPGGFWLHEGAWGQAAFSFGGLDLNDFQIQSFDASGIVSVSTADNPEGSAISGNPVRSYILPTVRLQPGESTVTVNGRSLICKNDLSAAIYSLDGLEGKYYDGSHRDLIRGANVPGIDALGTSGSTNWQGDRIYLFANNAVTIFGINTTIPSIERIAVIPVQLPVVPDGHSIQIAKCEFIEE
ncbi:hypothetical protein H6F75_00515 [Nodosilinea sp. FACHB-131]|uniref:hypothetical protein n=1 Tax=Cyanophyceae TaxID=3028117 RepID=UPI001681FE5C|nr:hypothetical protein [Nodosilinea sp. FACHB-131]MBD1871953.1 hypothetical protein [Nodosilinea sp. FACHB-131]